MDHICLDRSKLFSCRLYRSKELDPLSQILDLLFDLPVSVQLFTDRFDRIRGTLREHIVSDKLCSSIGHFQCDRTFFHCDKAVRIDIPKDHVIERAKVRFFGCVNAVDISFSPVILRLRPFIHKLSDVLIGITESVFCDISRFRHLSGMAEINKLPDLGIVSSYFKCDSDTGCDMRPGIFDLERDHGTEICPFTVCGTILLLTTEIA